MFEETCPPFVFLLTIGPIAWFIQMNFGLYEEVVNLLTSGQVAYYP
jgi:hypothetical protein